MLAALTACAQVGPRNRHFEDPVSPRKEAQVVSAGDQGAAAVLAGTAWRLVEIVSMDDRVDVPDDRSRYTLQFGADGSSVGESQPHLAGFGVDHLHQQAHLPGSLHDRYMAQFPWVRSYVFKDGRLFLATMADGSIIEFEKVP